LEASVEQVIQLTKETIIVTAQEVLGDQAGSVIERIRSAPDSPEALRDAVENCHSILQSTLDPESLNTISVVCSTLLRDLDEAVKENSKPAETDEKQALKARIVRAKLIAVTSGLLGTDGLELVEKLRAAPDTRDGLISVLKECESMADSSFTNAIASELKTKCADIVKQLS
jgi:hypothetical protein